MSAIVLAEPRSWSPLHTHRWVLKWSTFVGLGLAGNKDDIDDGDGDGDDGGGGVVDHHAGALVGELCPLHRPQAPLILFINVVNVDKKVAALLSLISSFNNSNSLVLHT